MGLKMAEFYSEFISGAQFHKSIYYIYQNFAEYEDRNIMERYLSKYKMGKKEELKFEHLSELKE